MSTLNYDDIGNVVPMVTNEPDSKDPFEFAIAKLDRRQFLKLTGYCWWRLDAFIRRS